ERELIKILGKKDEVGRPMLYGTAPAFLELFSLESLKDLPSLREFAELSEESQHVFEKATGEPAPSGEVRSELEGEEDESGEPSAEAAEGEQTAASDARAEELDRNLDDEADETVPEVDRPDAGESDAT